MNRSRVFAVAGTLAFAFAAATVLLLVPMWQREFSEFHLELPRLTAWAFGVPARVGALGIVGALLALGLWTRREGLLLATMAAGLMVPAAGLLAVRLALATLASPIG